MGWQPIATAPKDGTRFLAWGTLHAPGWNDGEHPSQEVCTWTQYGWYSPSLGGWEPTHWMSFPAPPAQPSNTREG